MNITINQGTDDVIIDIYDLLKLLKSGSDDRNNAILHLQEYILDRGEDVDDYPYDYEIESDWECSFGTMHPHTDNCDCDEYNQ